jgi:uncharacterized membrane-anchored protein
MKANSIWIATLAVQGLLLGGLVAREELELTRGTPVVLEVRAVDPMDVFSGRYVSVPLAISHLDAATVAHPEPMPPTGETIYVRLERAQDVFQAVEVARAPIDDSQSIWARATLASSPGSSTIDLDFGVERFFISEVAQDPSFRRDASGARLRITVAARVASDGRVRFEDLFVDGERYAAWNARQPK